jgi:hypothetical protein
MKGSAPSPPLIDRTRKSFTIDNTVFNVILAKTAETNMASIGAMDDDSIVCAACQLEDCPFSIDESDDQWICCIGCSANVVLITDSARNHKNLLTNWQQVCVHSKSSV